MINLDGYTERDFYLSDIENKIGLLLFDYCRKHKISEDDFTYVLNRISYDFVSKCFKKYIVEDNESE